MALKSSHDTIRAGKVYHIPGMGSGSNGDREGTGCKSHIVDRGYKFSCILDDRVCSTSYPDRVPEYNQDSRRSGLPLREGGWILVFFL